MPASVKCILLRAYGLKSIRCLVMCGQAPSWLMAKGRSDDLTAIFAQDDHVTADILFKVKRDNSLPFWLRARSTD